MTNIKTILKNVAYRNETNYGECHSADSRGTFVAIKYIWSY
jgi:hypothetical protein